MRILLLGNARSPHAARWAQAFADRGHDVKLASIRAADVPGVEVETVRFGPEPENRPFWALLSYLRLLVGIRRIAREFRPDVVHAHYSTTHGMIATVARMRPRVVSIWGSDVVGATGTVKGIPAVINRVVLRSADLVTSTSQFMIPHALRLAGAPIRVEHVPFGVDTDVFTPPDGEVNRDEFRIGFIKHLKPKYGPEILLAAMPKILAAVPNAHLIMAGEGQMENQLRDMAEPFIEHVDFVGRIAHESVPDLMRDLDVLVNPSVHESETFGVVLLEAMACGVPVVATAVGGVGEVVSPGQTGLLVKPADIKALADAVVALAARQGLAKALAEAASLAVARYEWALCVDSMESALENATSFRASKSRST